MSFTSTIPTPPPRQPPTQPTTERASPQRLGRFQSVRSATLRFRYSHNPRIRLRPRLHLHRPPLTTHHHPNIALLRCSPKPRCGCRHRHTAAAHRPLALATHPDTTAPAAAPCRPTEGYGCRSQTTTGKAVSYPHHRHALPIGTEQRLQVIGARPVPV